MLGRGLGARWLGARAPEAEPGQGQGPGPGPVAGGRWSGHGAEGRGAGLESGE